MVEISPLKLTTAAARRKIAELAADTDNIVVIPHGRKRGKQRNISRRQMELCLQKGVIIDGPFMNPHGNWQLTMERRAAGEEITCVVAIDWPSKLLVITTYERG